jgi:chaperonin GroEL
MNKSGESKNIMFGRETQDYLVSGVNTLADAVAVTMGPMGMNVIIESERGHPVVTKDGVTVAKSVRVKDPAENLGIDVVREAASRTADTAGDGTTTATVLARSIFSEGLKMIAAGYAPRDIISGLKESSKDVISFISETSRPVKDRGEIMSVATISANGESEIGELITSAMDTLGPDGVITVEEAKGFKSELVVVEGMQINRGYLSPYFVNNTEKMTAEFENPRILICNQKLTSIHKIAHLLEASLGSSTPILIIAPDIEGEAMQGLVVNTTRGTLKACAIKSPGFGNARVGMIEDLCLMLETRSVDTIDDSIEEITLEELGTCSRVVVSRAGTTFVDCPASKESIDSRSQEIKSALEGPMISDDERAVLRVRLSRLAGGVGIIRVGGATEGELIERRDRVDDALSATQAAVDEGIVPGGGTCLLRASTSLQLKNYNERVQPGVKIMKSACTAPIRQILENAGEASELIISKVLDSKGSSYGFNALTGEYTDMIKSGVIDPSKVTRCAVENAVSAACTLLSAGCTMTLEQNDQ